MAIIQNPTQASLLEGLLMTASKNWGGGEDITAQIMENMNKIAFHESKGITDKMQISDKTESGYGPGRGLFQFEIDQNGQGGAHTAINRLIEQIGYRPEFLEGLSESDYDISGLSPEQQQAIFLGNLLQMKNKDPGKGRVLANFAGVDTDEELADYWAQYHQAGEKLDTKGYDDNIAKFLEDLQEGYRKGLIKQ